MRKVNIRGYEPPCTLWLRVELEDIVLAASKDAVVNSSTEVSIERQTGANSSAWDKDNNKVVANDDYSINW